ncbi:hypothetical protein GGX14DRAFT_697448 [Mycena pura]|uniref:Uncharacterized protein n=1 Tax=Mycena pura TaxID=153505 RepID=A0AAD6VEY4_9AGAR|nr:hypothetical protein GGX14DRAFT_697448 [Mycena pura]
MKWTAPRGAPSRARATVADVRIPPHTFDVFRFARVRTPVRRRPRSTHSSSQYGILFGLAKQGYPWRFLRRTHSFGKSSVVQTIPLRSPNHSSSFIPSSNGIYMVTAENPKPRFQQLMEDAFNIFDGDNEPDIRATLDGIRKLKPLQVRDAENLEDLRQWMGRGLNLEKQAGGYAPDKGDLYDEVMSFLRRAVPVKTTGLDQFPRFVYAKEDVIPNDAAIEIHSKDVPSLKQNKLPVLPPPAGIFTNGSDFHPHVFLAYVRELYQAVVVQNTKREENRKHFYMLLESRTVFGTDGPVMFKMFTEFNMGVCATFPL